jgi:hypothetical protein
MPFPIFSKSKFVIQMLYGILAGKKLRLGEIARCIYPKYVI